MLRSNLHALSFTIGSTGSICLAEVLDYYRTGAASQLFSEDA